MATAKSRKKIRSYILKSDHESDKPTVFFFRLMPDETEDMLLKERGAVAVKANLRSVRNGISAEEALKEILAEDKNSEYLLSEKAIDRLIVRECLCGWSDLYDEDGISLLKYETDEDGKVKDELLSEISDHLKELADAFARGAEVTVEDLGKLRLLGKSQPDPSQGE